MNSNVRRTSDPTAYAEDPRVTAFWERYGQALQAARIPQKRDVPRHFQWNHITDAKSEARNPKSETNRKFKA
jgi:hypothetical protein